jgi:hypothetical protein
MTRRNAQVWEILWIGVWCCGSHGMATATETTTPAAVELIESGWTGMAETEIG